jgi:hypothetical protein
MVNAVAVRASQLASFAISRESQLLVAVELITRPRLWIGGCTLAVLVLASVSFWWKSSRRAVSVPTVRFITLPSGAQVSVSYG